MTKLQKTILSCLANNLEELEQFATNNPGYICKSENVDSMLYWTKDDGFVSIPVGEGCPAVKVEDPTIFFIDSDGSKEGEYTERYGTLQLDRTHYTTGYPTDKGPNGYAQVLMNTDKDGQFVSALNNVQSDFCVKNEKAIDSKGAETQIHIIPTAQTEISGTVMNPSGNVGDIYNNGANIKLESSAKSNWNNLTPGVTTKDGSTTSYAENVSSVNVVSEPIDCVSGELDGDQSYVSIVSDETLKTGVNKTPSQTKHAGIIVSHDMGTEYGTAIHQTVSEKTFGPLSGKTITEALSLNNPEENPISVITTVQEGNNPQQITTRYVAFTDQIPFTKTDNLNIEVDDDENWEYRTFAMKMDCSDNEGEGTAKRIGSIEMNPRDLSVSTTSRNSDDSFTESATAQIYLTKGDIQDVGSIANDSSATIFATSFSTNKETDVTVSNVCRADLNAAPAAAYEGVSGESNAILSAINRKSIPNSTPRRMQDKGAQIYLSDIHGIDNVFRADYSTGDNPVSVQQVGIALDNINKGKTVDWDAINDSVGTQLSDSGFLIYAPSVKVVDPTDETHTVKHVAFAEDVAPSPFQLYSVAEDDKKSMQAIDFDGVPFDLSLEDVTEDETHKNYRIDEVGKAGIRTVSATGVTDEAGVNYNTMIYQASLNAINDKYVEPEYAVQVKSETLIDNDGNMSSQSASIDIKTGMSTAEGDVTSEPFISMVINEYVQKNRTAERNDTTEFIFTNTYKENPICVDGYDGQYHTIRYVAFTDQLDELKAKNEALESRIEVLENALKAAGILTD